MDLEKNDKYENLRIGMNTGAIYKVDDFSYNINRLDAGPRVDYVSNIFNDNNGNWYFSDNLFRRTGKKAFDYNGYLLSIRNENDNNWVHIPKNENIMINNINLNAINKIDSKLNDEGFDESGLRGTNEEALRYAEENTFTNELANSPI